MQYTAINHHPEIYKYINIHEILQILLKYTNISICMESLKKTNLIIQILKKKKVSSNRHNDGDR